MKRVKKTQFDSILSLIKVLYSLFLLNLTSKFWLLPFVKQLNTNLSMWEVFVPDQDEVRCFVLWRDFFTLREKIEKFDILGGNFPNSNPNHKWLTQPKPQKVDPTQPGSKKFDPNPSLGLCSSWLWQTCVQSYLTPWFVIK